MTLSSADIEDLRTAKLLLETPGLAARISNFVGAQLRKDLHPGLPRSGAVAHERVPWHPD